MGRELIEAFHATGEAYVQRCQDWREALPDATGEVTAAVQEGDLAALRMHWTGTYGGTLHGPGLELPTTGKRIEGDATCGCERPTVRRASSVITRMC